MATVPSEELNKPTDLDQLEGKQRGQRWTPV